MLSFTECYESSKVGRGRDDITGAHACRGVRRINYQPAIRSALRLELRVFPFKQSRQVGQSGNIVAPQQYGPATTRDMISIRSGMKDFRITAAEFSDDLNTKFR